MSLQLHELPDDIIQQLLYFLPPWETLRSFQLTCRRFACLIDEPLLWKHHCTTTFKYWQPSHDFPTKLIQPAPIVAWKRLFIIRSLRNVRIQHLFDTIIKTQVGRHNNIRDICKFGYDARDFLLSQTNLDKSNEEILARRYWGITVLDTIHKSVAIDLWRLLETGASVGVRLEMALGAFDMFVVHDEPGDVADISRILDERVDEFRISHPNLNEWTTRQKAVALNKWIRANNLTGLRNSAQDYRNLRNCLIGQALRHEEHESIPVISCAIYCCMARRIGIMAHCSPFPNHVHVVVSSAPGQTLDHQPVNQTDKLQQKMFLDPFGKDDEVPEVMIRQFLAQLPGAIDVDSTMVPISTSFVVRRTANNIQATYVMLRELQGRASPRLTQLIHGSGGLNMQACFYATLWSWLILTSREHVNWDFNFNALVEECLSTWPQDFWLVESILLPLYYEGHNIPLARPEDALSRLRKIHRENELPPPLRKRGENECGKVTPDHLRRATVDVNSTYREPRFKVGQVFRHRTYSWLGVITGWQFGYNGAMCFFSYIRTVPIHSASAVLEHNMEIVDDLDLIRDTPFLNPGKYFKRFDPETRTFVSNVREQFPDD